MENILASAIEITSAQYMELENPVFVGQTRLNKDDQYWMVFEDNGKTYKILHTL